MKYVDLKNLIQDKLRHFPEGLTWKELKEELQLPYKVLCPEWTAQLEEEIGLNRSKGSSRAFVWRLHEKHPGENDVRR